MRIGFACQWLHPDRSLDTKELAEIEQEYRCRTTTVKWCSDNPDYDKKLWDIMKHNVKAITKLAIKVSRDPDPMKRMVRLSSDLLPLYTHPNFSHFYKSRDVKDYLEKMLPIIGKIKDIRLSFHPDQFCVLASSNENVVANSIREIEYHAYIAELMGFGQKFQDFKCNVHLSGDGGITQFRKSYGKLSEVARNILTIENDEFNAGLDYVLQVSDLVPIVLDVHHHWVNTGGYIRPDDARIKTIIDSWRGVRPVMHYSYSRSEYLPDQDNNKRPVYSKLQVNDADLRKHSDDYPNKASNEWALSFLEKFDIMCEAKFKNLARDQLIAQYKGEQVCY